MVSQGQCLAILHHFLAAVGTNRAQRPSHVPANPDLLRSESKPCAPLATHEGTTSVGYGGASSSTSSSSSDPVQHSNQTPLPLPQSKQTHQGVEVGGVTQAAQRHVVLRVLLLLGAGAGAAADAPLALTLRVIGLLLFGMLTGTRCERAKGDSSAEFSTELSFPFARSSACRLLLSRMMTHCQASPSSSLLLFALLPQPGVIRDHWSPARKKGDHRMPPPERPRPLIQLIHSKETLVSTGTGPVFRKFLFRMSKSPAPGPTLYCPVTLQKLVTITLQ